MSVERPARLIVLCGLPGSGKSTLARALEAQLQAVRMSPDDWMTALGVGMHDEPFRERIERLQVVMIERLLALKNTVIYESGGWTMRERDDLRDAARSLSALVELRFLDVSYDELWRRLELRNAASDGSAVVTQAELEQWAGWFERPTESELARYDTVQCTRSCRSGHATGTPATQGGSIQDSIQEIRRHRASQGNTSRIGQRTKRW